MFLVTVGSITFNLDQLVYARTETVNHKTVLALHFAVQMLAANGDTRLYRVQLDGYRASRMAAFLESRATDITTPPESTPN